MIADADMEKGDESALPISKEAAASLPVTPSGEADEVLASAVENLSLQENPLQAHFGDGRMEQPDPPSLPDVAEKSPATKSVADETMADVSKRKTELRKQNPWMLPSHRQTR